MKVQNLKIKQKISRTAFIFWFWPLYPRLKTTMRCSQRMTPTLWLIVALSFNVYSLHTDSGSARFNLRFENCMIYYIFGAKFSILSNFSQKVGKIFDYRLNSRKSETCGCVKTILLLPPKKLLILTSLR